MKEYKTQSLIGLLTYAPVERMGSMEEVKEIWARERAKIDRKISREEYEDVEDIQEELSKLPQRVIDNAVKHKFRPVLVVGATSNYDVVVLPITSQERHMPENGKWIYQTGLETHPMITLFKKEKCWIECDHPYTLDNRMLLTDSRSQCFDFGTLYPEDFYNICQKYFKFSQKMQEQQKDSLLKKMELLENRIPVSEAEKEPEPGQKSEPDLPAPGSHIRKSRNTRVVIGGQAKSINQEVTREEEKRPQEERQNSKSARKNYYPKQNKPKYKRKKKQQQKSQLS